MSDDSGRIALVTGSSKGIGSAIALRMAKAGYDVCVTYLDDSASAATVASAVEEFGVKALVTKLDVRDEGSVAATLKAVEDGYGHLDVLVNNAVREVSKPLDEATLEEWRTVIQTKIDGAFLCTKLSLPLFAKAKSPSMIALSTFEAQQPSPEFLAYGVANAALDAFIKGVAQFLPKYGARCNAVCPGPVRTPLWGPDETNEELWKELAAVSPVGRTATAEDVAEIVLMVAQEPTRMLNGNFIYVNGGNHLRQA